MISVKKKSLIILTHSYMTQSTLGKIILFVSFMFAGTDGKIRFCSSEKY